MGVVQSSEINEDWLRVVVAQLSPRIGEFGASILVEEVEPLIQRLLSSRDQEEDEPESGEPSRRFHFEKTDLGSEPPKISNIYAHRSSAIDGESPIVLDFDVSYAGDCDIQIRILGVHSGVRDVQVSGRARLVLRPPISRIPFIGGFQLFFLEEPKISFDFDGVADVCDWPVLRRKVRNELLEDINKHCVYPNGLRLALLRSVDQEEVRGFQPRGFLFVRIIQALGLPKKGGVRSLLGQGKPDTYAKIRIGSLSGITSVIKNSCDPNWEDPLWFEYPLETFQGHIVDIRLYDHDSLTRDEFLGKSRVSVADIMQTSETLNLQLEADEMEKTKYDEITGQIALEAKWIPFGQDNPDLSNIFPNFEGQNTLGMLTLFVFDCHNIGTTKSPPTSRLVIKFGSVEKKSDWERKDIHPQFGFGANFNVTADEIQTQPDIEIEVVDKTGTSLLTHSLAFSDIVSNPMKRNMIDLGDLNKSITLSARADFF